MKQKNRDINVVEQANTTKFSVLDAIVSPSRLKELFFDDVLSWYDCWLRQILQL